MSIYNVIALGDLKTSSEVENRTIVCGNFLTTASNFANQLNQNTFNALTYTLEINGSTTAGNTINVDSGSVALGPYPTNRFVLKSGTNNQYTVDGQIAFTLNQGNQGATIRADATLPSRCADIISSIQYLSKSLSQLPPNNNVTFPSSQPGPLNFYVNNVDANGIAVFNVSLTSVFNNNNIQQIQLYPQNTNLQLVIINLYGTSASWSGANLVGDWFNTVLTGRSHTIWNFYQATNLNFDSNIRGAVLAPYATVTTSQNIDGAIAAKTINAGGEVHLPLVVFPNCTTSPPQSTSSQF